MILEARHVKTGLGGSLDRSRNCQSALGGGDAGNGVPTRSQPDQSAVTACLATGGRVNHEIDLVVLYEPHGVVQPFGDLVHMRGRDAVAGKMSGSPVRRIELESHLGEDGCDLDPTVLSLSAREMNAAP